MPGRIIAICSTIIALSFVTLMSLVGTSAGQDGIIRVKSAYPLAGDGQTAEEGYRRQGDQVLRRDRSGKLAADSGIKLNPSVLADLRQSAARHSVHHRQRECRTRLAGAAPGVCERQGRGLDRLHGFRLDRAPSRHQESRRAVQDGIEGGRFDHVECESKIAISQRRIIRIVIATIGL